MKELKRGEEGKGSKRGKEEEISRKKWPKAAIDGRGGIGE